MIFKFHFFVWYTYDWYEVNITIVSPLDRDIKKWKIIDHFFITTDAKSLKKLTNQIQDWIKPWIYYNQGRFIPGIPGWSNDSNIRNFIYFNSPYWPTEGEKIWSSW